MRFLAGQWPEAPWPMELTVPMNSFLFPILMPPSTKVAEQQCNAYRYNRWSVLCTENAILRCQLMGAPRECPSSAPCARVCLMGVASFPCLCNVVQSCVN